MRFSLVILAAFAALAAAAPVADNGMDINNALAASAEAEMGFFDDAAKHVKNLAKQVKVPKVAATIKDKSTKGKTLLKGTTAKPKVRLTKVAAAVGAAVAAAADAAAAVPAEKEAPPADAAAAAEAPAA
ncbi:hypothetical protein HGRIS_004403 [Hohenbuehelia grisea]|uniref:Antifreeze protein n=1 Tax=Hohenbuehelia grisea TaxID=104357 RepID=A0ABR3JBR0_9AGAR